MKDIFINTSDKIKQKLTKLTQTYTNLHKLTHFILVHLVSEIKKPFF